MKNVFKRKFQKGFVELHCGDSYELLKTKAVNAARVDVCVCDPPYIFKLGKTSGTGLVKGCGLKGDRKYIKDIHGFTDGGFDIFILDYFKNWMVFGSLAQVPDYLSKGKGKGCMLLTWCKPNPTPLVNNNYLPDTEYIVHVWEKNRLYGGMAHRARFIVHPNGDKDHGEHPNEKPVRVMAKLLSTASDVGQVVCDPFMGSGTTGVAAVRMGRSFIGIERERKYFDVAVKRIEGELMNPGLF